MKDLKILLIISALINILLILLIYQGSVQIVALQEWINPTVVTTLIGGIGGALAGTWISGSNASKLWKQQKEIDRHNREYIDLKKKYIFYTLIHSELKKIESNSKVFFRILQINDFLKKEERDSEDIVKLFNDYFNDIIYCCNVIEDTYQEAKELLYSDFVNYEIFYELSEARVLTNDFYNCCCTGEAFFEEIIGLGRGENSFELNFSIEQTLKGIVCCTNTLTSLNEFLIKNVDVLVEKDII